MALLASVGSAIMYLLRNRGNDGVDLLISHFEILARSCNFIPGCFSRIRYYILNVSVFKVGSRSIICLAVSTKLGWRCVSVYTGIPVRV